MDTANCARRTQIRIPGTKFRIIALALEDKALAFEE